MIFFLKWKRRAMVATLFQLHLLGMVFVEVGLAILCVGCRGRSGS